MELLQSFTLKFLRWSISHQPPIRKHSYFTHRYPGGSAFIPRLLTPGSMSQGGAGGQNLGHLLKVFFYFSVMEVAYSDSWSDMTQPCDMDLWVMKGRSTWPIFHGAVILPYMLKTIWCMNNTLQDYKTVWHNILPQNKCRSLWPIFHGPMILPYSLKIWYIDTVFWGFWVSMTRCLT